MNIIINQMINKINDKFEYFRRECIVLVTSDLYQIINTILKNMKRKTALLVGPKKFELIEEEIPVVQPNEVRFKTVSIGMCHSDMPTYLGQSRMWLDEDGHYINITDLEYPTILGHEAVGIIEEVGSEVSGFEVGDYVSGTTLCMGTTSHFVVPAELVIKLPNTIKEEELKYWLFEPTLCCANVVEMAHPNLGDVIAIVGCGMMGLLTMKGLMASAHKKVIAIDINDSRLELAKKFGADETINPGKVDFKAELNRLTDKRGADIVIECTGSIRGLKTAFNTVRYADMFSPAGRGKICVVSVYGREETWDSEMGFEMLLRSPIIHVTHPPAMNDYARLTRDTVDAIESGILPIQDFISHEFSVEDIQEAYELMESGDTSLVKGIITF